MASEVSQAASGASHARSYGRKAFIILTCFSGLSQERGRCLQHGDQYDAIHAAHLLVVLDQRI